MADRSAILEQFQTLSPEEKLALIDDLWLATTDEIAAEPLSVVERAFLDARLSDASLHKDEERDWAQVRDELRRRT